ncbi:uncharacterized protein LOC103969051 isoform X5 [Musa acuminata AAA Group]|uniref:Transmembrane protein 230 n=1 Tax=Musa acuminata subsp. malaccensis TaxID=214687 RepID=A0A804KZH1_MUSAM|nr:PREDICTED: transmembrane protein 230-like isoform X2 [Musa acuminata subsp. malaccensis]CAG1854393.1 unnamed protein product [Musa acuminata subsp. malaccensis]
MAYVDRAFSISDEGITMDGAYVVHHRPPVKEIALAVGLLVLGALGVVLGIIMAANEVGGDRTHGVLFAILGSMLFIPGFYYTRIAYYAYKGYKGFSFSNIPPV